MITVEIQRAKGPEAKRLAPAIESRLAQHLAARGLSGAIRGMLVRKTGRGIPQDIKCMRPSDDSTSIIYHVRPFDRGSAWNVRVWPVPPLTIRKIIDAEGVLLAEEVEESALEDNIKKLIAAKARTKEEKIELWGLCQKWSEAYAGGDKERIRELDAELTRRMGGQNPMAPSETAAPQFVAQQMVMARVVRHRQYGLEVSLDEEGTRGLVLLEDLSQTRDPSELSRYPVDKPIRVVIADPSADPVKCTIKVEGVAEPASSKDVFSGVPDKDGVLSLKSFCEKHTRLNELGEALAVAGLGTSDESWDHKRVVDFVVQWFLEKYGPAGTTSVSSIAAMSVVRSMCSKTTALLRYDRDKDRVELTEFAKRELEIVAAPVVAEPQEAESVAEEPQEDEPPPEAPVEPPPLELEPSPQEDQEDAEVKRLLKFCLEQSAILQEALRELSEKVEQREKGDDPGDGG